jgi:multidrug efflux pump subunit AcrA (membrane-fusion protein)
MKKIAKWATIAIIALVFIGTFVFLFQKSQPKQTQYEINTAIVKDLQKTTIVTGKIEPRDEVSIKPQISGIITELYKEAGETVSKLVCRARGVFRHDGETPLVGDTVSVRIKDGEDVMISSISERKNELIRPAMSNLDILFVMFAAKRGNY